MVTHERDMLSRDVKRFEMEKEVAAAAAAVAAAAATSKYGRHGGGAVGVPFGAGSFSIICNRKFKTPTYLGTQSLALHKIYFRLECS